MAILRTPSPEPVAIQPEPEPDRVLIPSTPAVQVEEVPRYHTSSAYTATAVQADETEQKSLFQGFDAKTEGEGEVLPHLAHTYPYTEPYTDPYIYIFDNRAGRVGSSKWWLPTASALPQRSF